MTALCALAGSREDDKISRDLLFIVLKEYIFT